MAGPASILREIHRLRRHAKDLQTETERIPGRLKAQQNKVHKQEENLREAQESLKKLKVAVHEKEGTLRATHQAIAKHQKQLNEAVSNKKEYDALQSEIAAEKQTQRRLEDEILEGMAETEDRTNQLPELEKALQRAREECAQFEKESRTRQASLTEQLQQAQAQLKEVEAALPADIRPQYDRLLQARGEDAMAGLQNRSCQACYTEITGQMYNELLSGHFVMCKNCGRLLYLPE
jgi:predicted  nucleic acid-binding Zn-ribbon protein